MSEPDEDIATRYVWDDHNQVTSQVDPLGVVTVFAYDAAVGNQTSVARNAIENEDPTEKINVPTSYSYAAAGNDHVVRVQAAVDGPERQTGSSHEGSVELDARGSVEHLRHVDLQELTS